MATTKELLEQYQKKRKSIQVMATPEAIEKRHKGGQWTARERIDYFFDKGTFTEIGMFVEHRTTAFGLDKKTKSQPTVSLPASVRSMADMLVAAAEDYMALAGTFGENR